MDKNTYERIKVFILKYKYGAYTINLLNRFLTGLVYVIYPLSLLVLLWKKDDNLWKAIFIPGLSFILISIFRNRIDLPRPYELYDFKPLIGKETRGKSFPSRHVFSAFVIGGSLYHIWPVLGIFLLILASLIALIRVVGGLHFIRDVLFGALFGLALSLVWLIL